MGQLREGASAMTARRNVSGLARSTISFASLWDPDYTVRTMRIRRVVHTYPDAPVVRGLAFALLVLLPFAAWCAGDTSDIVVRVQKDGPVVNVEVDAPVSASRAVVWEVLT